ncbi:MAG: CAP domain-containing protein [Burkholderiales bacterium]|nr:CAP domain-containing protein [Burkholderiales bacterium]
MRSQPRGGAAFGLCALLLAGLAIATSAHPEALVRCGAIPTPDDALRLVNEARARGAMCHAAGGVTVAAPLKWSASLAAVAAAQAQDMAASNRMGHRDRQDRGLAERLNAMGYRYSAAAENVAVGYPTVDAVVDAWIDSAAHCDNLMNTAVREIGLACVDGRGHGAAPGDAGASPAEDRYWTLVLGAARPTR